MHLALSRGRAFFVEDVQRGSLQVAVEAAQSPEEDQRTQGGEEAGADMAWDRRLIAVGVDQDSCDVGSEREEEDDGDDVAGAVAEGFVE